MKKPVGLAVAMLVCAGLVAAALGTRAWATASGGRDSKYIGDTVTLGLFSVEGCDERRCRQYDWDDRNLGEDMPIPGMVATSRGLAMVMSIVAVGVLALCGVLAFAGTYLPRALVYSAVSLAFFLQIAFVGSVATWDSFTPSYSAFLALIGTGCGALFARSALPKQVAVPRLDRLPLPPPPPPRPHFAPPLPWPPPPPCAWCSAATQWSGHDRRWWCVRCAQFS